MLILDCVVDCESFEVLVLLSCLTLETGLALEALLTLYSFFFQVILTAYSPVQPLSVGYCFHLRFYTTFKDDKFTIYFLQTQLIFCVSYCDPLPVKLKV